MVNFTFAVNEVSAVANAGNGVKFSCAINKMLCVFYVSYVTSVSYVVAEGVEKNTRGLKRTRVPVLRRLSPP